MKLCKRCQKVPLKSNYEWYCPRCRELAKRDAQIRGNEQKKAKRRLRNNYVYNKNYGIEQETPPKGLNGLPPASRRWARMSWDEVLRENDYYGLRYRDSQLMAEKGTLPEDYGLKKKRKEAEGK